MDLQLVVLVVGGLLASALWLRSKDLWPMAVNLILIGLGTWALLWMLTNPGEAKDLQEHITALFKAGWVNILILVACQPLVFLAGKWLAKRLDRFDQSRKVKEGQ